MNHADWIQASGTAITGRGVGFRPMRAPAPIAKSLSQQKRHRKAVLRLAKANAPPPAVRSPAPQRSASRSPSILAQSAPGAAGVAAQLQHQAVVQRWHKP